MKPRKELTAREVDQLNATLVRRLGESNVPTLPQVAIKIVELVADRNASMQDIARVIETDPALTGRLLRMVNSAMYAQRTPITQLGRATVLLGIDRLKAVALGFHLSRTTSEDGGFTTRRIWTQSVFRAWLAFHLVDHIDSNLTGEAFIVGLMLDAAVPLMPAMIGPGYEQLINPEQTPARQFQAEFDMLPFTHVDLVRGLCQVWKLPDVLARPISAHHTRPETVRTEQPMSLLHAIAYFTGSLRLLADQVERNEFGEPVDLETARRLFGFEREELEEVLSRASRDYQASVAIFSDVLDPSISIEQILLTVNQQLNESVESLVERSLCDPSDITHRRIEVSGLVMEVEPISHGMVRVYIVDGLGDRIFSEDIDPAGRGRGELRSLLQLYKASDEQISEVFDQLLRIAA